MAETNLMVLAGDGVDQAALMELFKSNHSKFDDELAKDGARILQSLPVIKMDKDSNQLKIVLGEDQLYSDKELLVAAIAVFDFNILFLKVNGEGGETEDIRACSTDLTRVSDKTKVGAFRLNESTRGFAPFSDHHKMEDGSVVHKDCSLCPWSRSGTKKDVGGDGEGRACQSRKLYLMAYCAPSANVNGIQLYMPTGLAVMNVSMGSAWGFPGEVSKAINNAKRSIVTDIPSHAVVMKLTTELKGEGKTKYRVPHATSAGFIQYNKAAQSLADYGRIRDEVWAENQLAEQNIKYIQTEEDKKDIPF